MRNLGTTKAFSIALVITALIGIVAIVVDILITLLLYIYGHEAKGISAYAGGVGSGFINLLALALPFIFALVFLILRRGVR